MSNIEIEDFYHHDFTTATEWEIFIARLEEIMHEWKLSNMKIGPPLKSGDFVNCQWDQNSEKLLFHDIEFIVTHVKLRLENDDSENTLEEDEEERMQCLDDALNLSNDFVRSESDHLDIACNYGIREYLLLKSSNQDFQFDETKLRILLSSLAIAASNANCNIPTFWKMDRSCQKLYLGNCIGKSIRAQFGMVHLKQVPSYTKYLNGLLSLFKQKIRGDYDVRENPVMVSVKYTYLLSEWMWAQEPPDFDFMQGEIIGVSELGKLPFGAAIDPINKLHLMAIWPEMPENVIFDSETYTNLEAHLAPKWSVQIEMCPVSSEDTGLLTKYLEHFLYFYESKDNISDFFGDDPTYSQSNDQALGALAFNILTESKIQTISSVVGKATMRKSKSASGSIPEDILLPILYFLFPDAEENSKAPYGDLTMSNANDDQWKGVKTCPMDSLVWRLAIVAAHCVRNFSEAALIQLWYEFVQEIRFRWERSITIPGIISGFPDHVRTCLLHQKLQMINCCIEKKKARTELAYKSQNTSADDFETAESEEEEFFECSNDGETNTEDTTAKAHKNTKHMLWNKPVGRLARHPSFKLLQTGDPLYLPVTQDPVPKTEDQLEEDARIMIQLGTDKQASEMRARIMSASLLSDMESFKAANPGAILEDFIRWYSPRDWIEDEETDEWDQQKGHLSDRMLIPDNPWSKTWSSAQPVPAHRQKRLFDDTREAEKALHYLSSRCVGQVVELLLPTLTHAALYTLSQQKQDALPNLPDVALSILNKLQQAAKVVDQKQHLYMKIVEDIGGVEALVAEVNFLQRALGGTNDSKEFTSFIIQLMRGKEVEVPGGPNGSIGLRIAAMFKESQKAALGITSTDSDTEDIDGFTRSMAKAFSKPLRKEFILRTIAPRPTIISTPLPQRLYACLNNGDIKLAGIFSEDTIFF